MWAATISASSILISIGFIFWTVTSTSERILSTTVIVLGLFVMTFSLFLTMREDSKKAIRELTLMVNLMAIANKLGVGAKEMKEARHLLDAIDAQGNVKHPHKSKKEKGV